jgi:hypothetical protein
MNLSTYRYCRLTMYIIDNRSLRNHALLVYLSGITAVKESTSRHIDIRFVEMVRSPLGIMI